MVQQMAMEGAGRKVFTLLVEMRCNSYCVFCGQREIDEPLVKVRSRLGLATPETQFAKAKGRYTLETASSALADARLEGFTELSLQGGEPTLFHSIAPLIAHAKKLGFAHVGIVTNGRRLADPEFAASLLAAGLDALTVSFVGHDAASHDAIAAATGAFDQLVAGLRNVVAIARREKRAMTINANLITSARTVEHLPDQVRLLAELGVDAGGIHLVRFSGLASEPGVREPLRFNIHQLRAPLAAAMAESARTGMHLHATDVPICLHPELSSEELRLLERRARIEHHRYEAPAFGFDLQSRHPRPAACEGCLLDRACTRVPPEYLDATASAFSPITVADVTARIGGELAAIDPDARDPQRVTRVIDRQRALVLLAQIAGDPSLFAGEIARLDEALADLALHAFRRRDGDEMLPAFFATLGLHPHNDLRADARIWSLLARASAATEILPGAHHKLQFAHRLTVALDGTRDGEELEIRDATGACRAPIGPRDRVLQSLFSVFVIEPLRRARRLRVADSGIDADTGEGWVRCWSFARPSAVTLS
jgi:MoaA/NifB/PqqE/SkfB family radical SAM enzyme